MKMESSGYAASAHMPSPALVVFSQAAAGGLGEALRIQRPFHSQLPDPKDLHHLSLVGSYGAHLLHGIPHHFLHPLNPAVSQANTTGSPFSGGGAFVKPFPSSLPMPSAFAPPKCVGLNGLDQGMMFSGNESFRTDSSSPACTSLSPPVKEESLEGHTSEEGDRERICTPERSPETPGFRPPKPNPNGAEPLNLRMDNAQQSVLHRFPFYNSFKSFYQHSPGVGIKKPPTNNSPPPNTCPVCGVQIAANELESHFLAELDRLYKLSTAQERQRIRASFNMNHPVQGQSIQGPDSRWETFQRIRTNRQGRLRAKTRKRKGDSESEYGPDTAMIRNSQCQSCPVCHGRLQRTPEEIAQHVEECLKRSGQTRTADEEDETVDVESYGDDTPTAVNLAAQNNNNTIANNNNNNNIMTKMEGTPPPPPPPPPLRQMHEENGISSGGHNPWDRKHRIPMSLNCTATSIATTAPTRATPTSSDQAMDVDFSQEQTTLDQRNHHQDHQGNGDEDVIVDRNDEEECIKRSRQLMEKRADEKNNTEEATSSVEIDSATDPNTVIKAAVTTPDSYVSTSESAEPPTRTQMLEELRARIRELEGSPFKVRSSQDEDHYKCFICKEAYKAPVISTICWHVHCDDCWITIADNKKSCPQCNLITMTTDLRKIHV